jgi:hypothetical protein
VSGCLGDSGKDHFRWAGFQGLVTGLVEAKPRNPVVILGCEVKVEVAIRIETGGQRKAQQATFTTGNHTRYPSNLLALTVPDALEESTVALGYHCSAVRKEDRRPWQLKPDVDLPGYARWLCRSGGGG